jgi:hypothetical protein
MKKTLLNRMALTATIIAVLLLTLNTTATFAALKTWNGGLGVGKNWTTPANWNPAGAPAAADDVLFNTAGVITFSTMPASGSYASLEVSNGAVVTFVGGAACTLTLGSIGADPDFLVAGGGSSLTLGTNVSIILAASATANISGDFFVGTGRIFDATAAGVVTSVFGTINNAGTVNGTLSTLTFQSGCAYVHNQDGGTIPTATWNATSLCSITGLIALHPAGGNQAFGNLTYNCPGMNTNLTMVNGVSVANDFTISNTGSARLLMTNGSLTVGRDMDIQANFTVSGTTDRTLTVVRDIAISGGGNLDLCSGIGGNVGTLNIGGNLTSFGAITETGTGRGQINFNGSTAQVFNQSGAFVNTIGIGINNTVGVTFSNSVTINDALTLTNGILTIPASTTLTIANGNVIGGTGFGATKHIATAVAGAAQGFLRVDNFAVSTPYLFPVGTGTIYLPVTLNSANTLANNTFSVAAFNGVTTNGLPNGTAFSPAQKDKSVDAVWTVNYNGAGTPLAPAAVTMTLAWAASLEGASFSVFTPSQIGIAHWDNPNWGACSGTGDNSANTATRTGVTLFSPFGVGGTPSVLPIKFSYLNVSKGNGYNTLNWKAECTGAELSYVIERSSDGRNFAAINTIAANQVNCSQPFSYNDNTVLYGTVFYRIKVINTDGISINSGIVKVGAQAVDMRIGGILPNPVSNTAQLNIIIAKKDKVELAIISPEGKVVYKNMLQLQAGTSIVPLEIANLSKGTYILRGVFGDGQISHIKFVKQ